MTPRRTSCHQGLIQPSRLKMLKMSASRSMPTSVEPTPPCPPVKSVPPTTTAAMASSSQPTAATGCPVPTPPPRGRPDKNPAVGGPGRDAPRHGDQRADREVYPARQDDERHAER